jgi:uncharacterized protein with PIN domain
MQVWRCPKCNTTLASGPEGHETPIPHVFELKENVDTDEGIKVLSRCETCYKTRKQLGVN